MFILWKWKVKKILSETTVSFIKNSIEYLYPLRHIQTLDFHKWNTVNKSLETLIPKSKNKYSLIFSGSCIFVVSSLKKFFSVPDEFNFRISNSLVYEKTYAVQFRYRKNSSRKAQFLPFHEMLITLERKTLKNHKKQLGTFLLI